MKLKGINVNDFNILAGKFSGVLDFYYWKGVPVVRRWPKKFGGIMKRNQIASYQAFGEVAKRKSRMPGLLREQFRIFARGSTETWGDVFTRWMMNAYAEEGELPDEIVDFEVPGWENGYVNGVYILTDKKPPSKWQLYMGKYRSVHNIPTYRQYRGMPVNCVRNGVAPRSKRVKMKIKVEHILDRRDAKFTSETRRFEAHGETKPQLWWKQRLETLFLKQPKYPSYQNFAYAFALLDVNVIGHATESYGGKVETSKTKGVFTPAFGPYAPEEINGIRWYFITSDPIFHSPRVTVVESPLESNRLDWRGDTSKSITQPYQPSGYDPVTVYFTPLDINFPEHWDIFEYPYDFWRNAPYLQPKMYALTVGPRNSYAFTFQTPCPEPLIITGLSAAGKEYPVAPIATLANPLTIIPEGNIPPYPFPVDPPFSDDPVEQQIYLENMSEFGT